MYTLVRKLEAFLLYFARLHASLEWGEKGFQCSSVSSRAPHNFFQGPGESNINLAERSGEAKSLM